MFRHLSILILMSFVPLGLATKASAKDDEVDTTTLYSKVVKSCVFVGVPMKDGVATASGALIDAKQRLVLTAAHVLGDEEQAFVQFPIFKKDGRVDRDKDRVLARVKDGTAVAAKVLHKTRPETWLFCNSTRARRDAALSIAEKNTVPGAGVWHIGSPGAVHQPSSPKVRSGWFKSWRSSLPTGRKRRPPRGES